MKKFIVGLMMLVMCFGMFAQLNPFDSFMGAKWGCDKAEFDKTFRYKVDKKVIEGRYSVDNVLLGKILLNYILIGFKKNPKDKKFYFNFAEFTYTTSNKERVKDLIEVFKSKYGKPTLETRELIVWKNGDRAIEMTTESFLPDEGYVELYSIQTRKDENTEEERQKKKNIKDAAGQL